jgi:hypothetical protein
VKNATFALTQMLVHKKKLKSLLAPMKRVTVNHPPKRRRAKRRRKGVRKPQIRL